MELRHLRYFIAVAEELNFTRAAERLQIAQPPLSQQIQALELELGVQLFDRKKRPLHITLAGQAFLEEARLILSQLDQAIRKTQRIHQGELGYLTIGFATSVANSVLPDILRIYQKQYPEVKLILREEKSIFQVQELRARRVDCAFVYQYEELKEASDLRIIPIVQEDLVLVLPETHPLAVNDQISLSDLADEEFVMPLHQVVSGLSEQIYYLCSQAGFVPNVSQEAVFMVTILGLVASGLGISILPASVKNLPRSGVVYRAIVESTMVTQLAVLCLKDNETAALQNLLNLIERTH